MDLSKVENRERLITSIESSNNKARKQWSFRQFEVMGGRIQQFVKESLLGDLDPESVLEMPIVSSINVQKAVTDKKATIYKKKPTREFSETTDEQQEKLELVYRDMKLDMRLNKANKNYVYQDQTIGMIIPKDGKLIARIFAMHQIDAIIDDSDPETAKGFVISAFDRTEYEQLDSDRKEKQTATGYTGRSVQSDSMSDNKLEVAEKYQFQRYVQKYIVWTKDYNFMMNGLYEVLDPETGEPGEGIDISSPIAGTIPFFEVSRDKDFEFFVRPSNALTDFTVQFNERLSDLANVQKMNGYAVGILKTPTDLKPTNLVIGASKLIHLATDNPDQIVDFQFASPQSAINEISDANDKFLNYFITSEGLGGDVVNSKGETQKASSGVDRFLQAIQKTEAHIDDYEAFRCAESDIYRIIKAWMTVLNGSNKLDKKYWTALPEESEIHVEYVKPEMMQTESEQITNIEKKMDLGLMSKREAIMELRQIEDEEKADEIIKKIEEVDPRINEIDEMDEELDAKEEKSEGRDKSKPE